MMNMARAELLGWGVKVAYPNLTEASLTWGLEEALTNEKYQANVKKVAARLRDQPQTPMEKAVYWTEYVLRHEGAHFMQTSAQYLSFVEYNNLDIFALVALVIFSAIFVPTFVACRIFKRLFSKKPKNSKQKLS
jgi:glucuronosyltransferase